MGELLPILDERYSRSKRAAVATGTQFPESLSTSFGTAGSQGSYRSGHHFPRGASRPSLIFTSVGAVAPETPTATGFPLKVAVAVEPETWNPAKTYQPGDQVVHLPVNVGSGAFHQNRYFVCAVANTGSPPTPANPNWSAGVRPATIPVTLNGVQSLSVGTQTLPDGSTVATAMIESDPVPIVVPVGGWLAVYSWLPCSGSQVFVSAGQAQPPWLAPSGGMAASMADRTGSGNMNPASVNTGVMRPAAIAGVPLEPSKSVVVFADSIGDGKVGTSHVSGAAIVSGGSGYKAGDLLDINNSGATAGAVAAGSAVQIIVETVDGGGAITGLRVIAGGAYANTVSQTGQTLPNGTQTLLGGSGTGGTVTVSFGANAYDIGDRLGGQGFVQRALAAAGIPYVAFTSSGDRANLYAARDWTRMGVLAKAPCRTALIALGRNDLSVGDSAATLQANIQALAAKARGLGAEKVFVCTVTPETASSTAAGQSTLADQSVTANDPQRQVYNAWLRAGPAGIDGVIDIAAAIESGTSGKFAPIGGKPAAADGKHPGPAAMALMQAAVTAKVAEFV